MKLLRWGGGAMVLAGVLFVGRIAPVISAQPDDVSFPPDNTADLVRLAEAAGSAWPFAHILGLIAATLMVFGYLAHAKILGTVGKNLMGRLSLIAAIVAFSLFGMALVIDGFLVYGSAVSEPANLERVAELHADAIGFFTVAIFIQFVAIFLLASRMTHGLVHFCPVGWLGQALAIIAVSAFLAGWAGPHWNNMQVGGSLVMLGFAWQVLVGLFALFGPGLRRQSLGSAGASAST